MIPNTLSFQTPCTKLSVWNKYTDDFIMKKKLHHKCEEADVYVATLRPVKMSFTALVLANLLHFWLCDA